MDGESNGALGQGPLVGSWWSPSSTDVMSQLCRVCGEPAAGFHFGAFTCEGCKSFFGRTYNNLGSITECKNQGTCVINKKNRTSCKACRLRKCLLVGMSKSGSRYGRRSNWFKIHCLLQEQQHQQQQQQQQQHVPPPAASPLDKSLKQPGQGLRAPRGLALGLSLGADGLYAGGTPLPGPALLWATPRGLPGPPAPLPFSPFLPAFNGAVAAPLFAAHGIPPREAQEWRRGASPPTSPRPRSLTAGQTPRRGPSARLPPPAADADVEQDQPMDLSRTAPAAPVRAATAPMSPPEAPLDECGSDAGDSGVSERESDRAADGDIDVESAATGSRGTSPVDLSARLPTS